MPDLDIILRGATVVTHLGETVEDMGIAGERIVAISPDIQASCKNEIDLKGFHIFPGVIDAHVHFNDPGRADWEGLDTGSTAFAAGGGTLFFDMPLNSHPPTLDVESFDLKLSQGLAKSVTDFALWGGLVPQNIEHLESLAEHGVIGFKAFMSESGIADFSRADESTLRAGMKIAAQCRRLVAVHAESDTMTKNLAAKSVAEGRTSIRDYLNSRPVVAELEAIRMAIDISGETGCALHIVHVSSGAGVALIAEAKGRGADVTCETCPHYLTLTEEDVERLGAVAKCAPPLRPADVQLRLWEQLNAGNLDTIGSDHSPAPASMKGDANFFKVWGGISGVQHTLPLLLTSPHFSKNRALQTIARLTSYNVARRFALPPAKHGIAVGAHADLAIVNLRDEFKVCAEDLLYRHRQSPYIGRVLRGRLHQTILRGKTIFQNGKLVAKASGNLVKPIL
jgi:allantoinase